jgi:hypothetical protein
MEGWVQWDYQKFGLGVQLDIIGPKALKFFFFCELKAKLNSIHNRLGGGECKCIIATPLATLLAGLDRKQ